MKAQFIISFLFVTFASCMTQRSEPVGSCTQAISLSDLRIFPEHYLPYAKNKSYTISAPPDNSYSHYGKGKYAWDIATRDGNKGAPLVASIDGCVRLVKRDATKRFGSQADANNVNYVVLTWPKRIASRYRAGADIESLYLHLDSISPNIRPGVCIKRGDPIGITGCTGWCTGTHLHYQVQERPANSSYWGQSVPIGFAERIAPRGNIAARSMNPGPMVSSGNTSGGNSSSGVQSPGTNNSSNSNSSGNANSSSGSSPTGVDTSSQTKPPGTSQEQPVDLDFACSELEKINASFPACLSRIAGFGNRPELVDCKAQKIEHCVMGCVKNTDDGSQDQCFSLNRTKGDEKSPDGNNDGTPNEDGKTDERNDFDPLNNDNQVPPSDLEQETLVPKTKEC